MGNLGNLFLLLFKALISDSKKSVIHFPNTVLYSWALVRYDYYYDKITIATMVIINTNGKLLFCMDKKIEFDEFEQALDKVMLEYKKALVRQKIQEIDKDFKV